MGTVVAATEADSEVAVDEVVADMVVDATDMEEMMGVMAEVDMVVVREDMVVVDQVMEVDKEVTGVAKEDMEAEDTKLYLIMYKIPFLSILMFELLASVVISSFVKTWLGNFSQLWLVTDLIN